MTLRRLVAVLILVLASGTVVTTPVAAQATPAEAARVLLDAAAAFGADGRTEVARALYELVIRRYPGTTVADEARQALDALPRGEPAPVPSSGSASPVTSDGRTELTVWSTTYGLFLGVALPTALGANDSAPYGLGLLLGGPGGFLLGRALAGSREPTLGQARAITFAGTWGTWQGAGWRDVLEIGSSEICDEFACYDNEDTTEETFAAMIVGGITGIAVGTALSRRNITAGTASAVNFGSLWGTWFGVATGVLLDLENDGLLTSTLVGGDVGLLYTALMAPRWNVTRNRARMVSIAGVIGALGGGGLNLIADTRNEKVLVGVPLATSLIGLAFGAAATRDLSGAGSDGQDRDDDSGGALLSLNRGRWRMDAPLPFPVMLERPGRAGLRRSPGLGFMLLRATF